MFFNLHIPMLQIDTIPFFKLVSRFCGKKSIFRTFLSVTPKSEGFYTCRRYLLLSKNVFIEHYDCSDSFMPAAVVIGLKVER